jgi:uncharacterized protein with HEPN domain
MRDALARLNDARAYACQAQAEAGGLNPDALSTLDQPRHAALYCLTVIGTALAAVPVEIRSLAPDLPWRAVIGLRNMVVHAYWQLDYAIVADVIDSRLTPLIRQLDQLIGRLERDPL